MKRSTMFLLLTLLLLVVNVSYADDDYTFRRSGVEELVGQSTDLNKASRDTIVLIGPWGSGAQVNGQFEDVNGIQAWNGWTHYDVTQTTETHWNISDYFADNLGLDPQVGNLAAWCGDLSFEPCSEDDPAGGYGNDWNDVIEFRATVATPTVGSEVEFMAYANIDSEPAYDGTSVRYSTVNGWVTATYLDGVRPNTFINVAFTVGVEDYVGENNDEILITVNFVSDGGWSDQDCSFPSAGGVQIDDITINVDQGSGVDSYFTDFEDGWGDWVIGLPDGVGDFAKLWNDLEDIDPCSSNYSYQVAFIDDGEVVPGTGPSLCIDWCYGPGGYIVNTTGGLAGPEEHLNVVVESPVLTWPEGGIGGAYLGFDVYRHEDLSADAPGTCYMFGVRSTSSDDPADLEDQPWEDRNGYYIGGPDYFRDQFFISDLMESGVKYAQVQLRCREVGYLFGWEGNDGYPAPYFDNVKFLAYNRSGPSMSTDELNLFQDNFPTIGEVLFNDLGLNSVRLDMARNIAPVADNHNDPGDSISINIEPGRAGAELVGAPELHWVMKQNTLFNEFRTSEYGTATSGIAYGVPAVGSSGIPTPGVYAFDLPDENFFFPGDIIHYNIQATDALDGADEQTSILPGNQDGFGDFTQHLNYASSFTVRALPTIYEDPLNPGTLVTPKTLFWNDFANRGGENEWHGALANIGLESGKAYDTYYTNRPDAVEYNGLGGRATPYSILNYENMLYCSGDLNTGLIGNGDFTTGVSDDVQLLDSWLRQGDKNLFLSGDDLVSDLNQSGAATVQFVEDWMKVTHVTNALRPLVGNQATPLVKPVSGNGVFLDDMAWVAYGGCRIINNFDAVTADALNGGIRLAEFASSTGSVGVYNYSAATLYQDEMTGSQVLSMPHDFMYIYTPVGGDKANASLPARAKVLESILSLFGVEGDPLDITPVPGAQKFAVRNYPNPFNPTTRIEFTMPKAGHLSLKVFNVRGELVKTLIDDHREDSGSIMWDGSDDRGAKVGSGVYFYEARTAGQVMVQKMALVK